MDIGDQDRFWAPHVICGSCRSNLEGWLRGSGRLSFAFPRVWKEPQNHHDDCYFCMINILKYRKVRGRRAMTYSSIFSSIAPVPHSDALTIPNPPSNVSNFLWVSVTNSNLYVLRPDPISCHVLVLYHFK